MRVGHLATIRDVDRPHANTTAGCCDSAGLDLSLENGCGIQTDGDARQAYPADHRDPVPAPRSPCRHLVPRALQALAGKGRIGALELLQGEDIGLDPVNPLAQPISPCGD